MPILTRPTLLTQGTRQLGGRLAFFGLNQAISDPTDLLHYWSLRSDTKGETPLLVTLKRESDSAEQDFYAGPDGYLPRAAILDWANGSVVRVASINNNGQGTADAVQTTLASMPPLDLSRSPARIESEAGTSLYADIPANIDDAIIVTADKFGVYQVTEDLTIGSYLLRASRGLNEQAVLAADTPAEDVAAVVKNMERAWGAYSGSFDLGIDNPAGAVNLTITLTSGGTYDIDWGDGNISTDVASGVAATNTYASVYEGPVRIRAAVDNPVTQVRSTAGSWRFDINADLPPSVTSLSLYNTPSTITGDIGNNSTLTTLSLYNTSCAITGDIGDNSTLTNLQLQNTLSTITGSISDNSTITTLSLYDTSSIITGDIGGNSTFTYLHLGNTSSTITGGGPSSAASFRYLNADNLSLSQLDIDDILVTLASITTWTNEKQVYLTGNSAPSAIGLAAKATLEDPGVGATVNVATNYAYHDLGIDNPSGAVDLTITLESGGTYEVDWGDGNVSTDVASGVAATNTYASAYEGNVRVTTPASNPVTEIRSSAGSWQFDINADLPPSVTILDLRDTPSTITGSISDNSTLTYLNVLNTPSTITGDIGDNSTLTVLNLRSTFSTITGDIGDNSTITYLHLYDTLSAITGDIGANTELTYLNLSDTSSMITGGTPFNTSDSARYFNFRDIAPGYSTAVVDAILNSLAAETIWSNEKIIDLSGTHDPRSSASDAAVATLQGYDVTVNTSPAVQALAIDNPAGAVNLTATLLSAATYDVDWGDGNVSTGVVSGVAATNTYASAYEGNVRVTTSASNSVTEIRSTAGAWAFDLSDLAKSVTYLNLSGTSSIITGDIGDNSTLTFLALYNTSSTITGDIGDNSKLTYLNLYNTSSAITGLISDNSTLTYLHLGATPSTITGDIGGNSTLTALYLYSASSTITGDIGDNSTLTVLNLVNTSSTITGSISDNSTLTLLNLSNTSSTITGSINDNSTLTYLDIYGTSSAITGDIGTNSTLAYLRLDNTSSTITGGTPFDTSGSARYFGFSDITPGYSTATVDAIIISLAAETTWSNEKIINLSGTHDPRSSASDAAVAALTDLGVIVTTSPAVQALAIDNPAGAVNLTATLLSASTYDVDWGDGTVSTGVASGVAATHTYAAPYDGDVVIDYEGGALTEMSSTAGAWTFDLSDLAKSVTSLNFSNIPSTITGSISDNSTITSLRILNTSSTITGSISDNSTLTYLNLQDTSSTITGSISDNSTLTYLYLGNTSSTITGDIGANSTITNLNLSNTSSTIAGGTPFNTSGSVQVFNFADITPGYSTATVDAIINSLGAETTWSGSKIINLSGTHSPRSSASDAAVAALTDLGVTVTTSPEPFLVSDGAGGFEQFQVSDSVGGFINFEVEK